MDVEPVKIAADMREPEEVVSFITALGVAVKRKVLTPGDYVLSANHAAERKAVSDFMSSLFERTFFKQLEALKEAYPRPMLILEGDVSSHLLLISSGSFSRDCSEANAVSVSHRTV